VDAFECKNELIKIYEEMKRLAGTTSTGRKILNRKAMNELLNEGLAWHTKEEILQYLEKAKGGLEAFMHFVKEEPAKAERLLQLSKVCSSLLDKVGKDMLNVDSGSRFFYNPQTDDFELELSSLGPLKFLDKRISELEFKQQVWCYLDIEKPFWKRWWEKLYLTARELISETRVNRKYSSWLVDKMEELEKEALLKSDEHTSDVLTTFSILKEKCKRGAFAEALDVVEKKLTLQLGGHEVKLWEEPYDAKISYYSLIFKLHDGTKIREIHTIHESGLNEVQGFSVYTHKDEKELISAIIKRMKELNVAVILGYNLCYDVIQSREAAKRTKAEPMDLFITAIFPRRAYVRAAYQEMRKDIEYIDLWRLAVVNHGFFIGKNPPGDLKLATLSKYLLGEHGLTKAFSYDELRELEAKAIAGDKEAVRLILNYSTKDVEILEKIIESNENYLKRIFKVHKLIPNTPLTKVAFSPNCVLDIFEENHFRRHQNLLFYGYAQKKREDELQIFKKRFVSIKHDRLKKAKIDVRSKPGTYPCVWQVYLPLEEWLKEVVITAAPQWQDYYAALSSSPVERFGDLQYPRAFLREILADYYFVMNEFTRYNNMLGQIPLRRLEIEGRINSYENAAKKQMLNRYYRLFEELKTRYRSIYSALNKKLRAAIRADRTKKLHAQKTFFFMDFFKRDNEELFLLRANAEKVMPALDIKKQSLLNGFLTAFDSLEKLNKELEPLAKKYSNTQLSALNLIYLSNQRSRLIKRIKKFHSKYHLTPFEPSKYPLNLEQIQPSGDSAPLEGKSVRYLFNKSYHDLKRELERIGSVVHLRGDYLFLVTSNGQELNFSKAALIPLRCIENFSLPYSTAQAQFQLDQLQLFGDWFEEQELLEDGQSASLLEEPLDILEESS
ncbi:MAG: hypothetical protein QXU88_02525, partial [Candidatus Woesearchaeota archaeon]